MIDLEHLKNMSSVRKFNKDDIVIQDGDTDADGMFIILKGRVGVYKNHGKPNEISLTTLNPGDFFGEMALFLNEHRMATVVALEDVLALEINRLNAYSFLQKQPAAAFNVIRALCVRIQGLTGKLTGDSESEPDIPVPVITSALFAEGHKGYGIPLKNPEEGLVMDKSYQCPLCLHSFVRKIPRQSKLIVEKMDPDTRTYFAGIEPMYYEVITCPKCWLSAFTAQFEKAFSNKEQELYDLIAPHKNDLVVPGKAPKSMDEVFAGYYLAMLCAPKCFFKSQLTIARIWLRLSWFYRDCEDFEMESRAVAQACEWYMEAITKVNIPDSQMQKLFLVLGELYVKQKDYDAARRYLFKAITDKTATSNVFKRMAEDRVADIKKIIQEEKG